MSQDPDELLTTGETPSGHAAPEISPSEAGTFIGFAPFSQPITPEVASEAPPVTSATNLQPADACQINLREGCYRVTFQPNTGTSIFHGTMRVEKRADRSVISGDLYRFLNPNISLPASVAAAAASAVRPAANTIFDLPLGIPVYPRGKYHSYLQVTRVTMPQPGGRCVFELTAQEYVFTQPPPGQFNGTFPPAPGTRTVRIELGNAVRPPGYNSVYFEGKLFEGATGKGSFKMGWVSSFFRRAVVEIDTLKGAVPPQPVPSITGSGTEDFKTAFKTAGWDLTIVNDQQDIPVPPGVNPNDEWSDADLHALLLAHRKASTDLDKEWRFHLMVVPARLNSGRGVMYDTIDVPREGAASFSNDGYPGDESSNFGAAAEKMQRDVPRAYMRSACHELGHGFNQVHQEQEGGADNSLMTTTPSVADVLGGPGNGQPGVFPDQINLGFNEHVRQHLIHFPDPVVRPGGMTFASGHSSIVPQSDRDRHYFDTADLELRVTAHQKQIELGEPLVLQWEMVNNSPGPIPAPNDISTESLYANITVINPNGQIKPMPPFVIRCEAGKIEELPAGGRVRAETRLYWSSRGFAFERSGRHIIEIQVHWSVVRVPFGVRARTDVWVNFPQSNRDNDAASTLMHPEVGMYVALGGGAGHLPDAVERLSRAFGGAASFGATDAVGGAVSGALRGYLGLLSGTATDSATPAATAQDFIAGRAGAKSSSKSSTKRGAKAGRAAKASKKRR